MKIGVIKEIEFGEHRVALIPEVVSRLVKNGLEVLLESHAGESSFLRMQLMKRLEPRLFLTKVF